MCHYRCSLGYGVGMPVLPVRNNLRRPNSSHHFSSASRFQFQKGFASRCSWKCTSIVLIIVCLLMAVALTYITCKFSKYVYVYRIIIDKKKKIHLCIIKITIMRNMFIRLICSIKPFAVIVPRSSIVFGAGR